MNFNSKYRSSKVAALATAGGLAVLGLLAAPGSALAAQIYGSGGVMTDRFCAAGELSCIQPNGFATGGTLTPHQYNGGFGVGFSASASLPGGASASQSVSFGGDYLPTVKVASVAGPETRTGSSATGFQSFTYNGDVAIDLAIMGSLHFFTSGDLPGPGPHNEFAGDGMLNAALAILPISKVHGRFGPGSSGQAIVNATDVFYCGLGSATAAGSYNSSGVGAGEHTATLGVSETCDGGRITINPGQTFAVFAIVQALSNRNGYVDAMNTFTVSFDEENTFVSGTDQKVASGFLSQSVSQGAAVPEPGAWALMILGFGSAGAMLRRRRAVAA